MPHSPSLTFIGDRTTRFDPTSGAGTIGKVIGLGGRWFRITDAVYDDATGRTRCVLQRLQDPNVVLGRHVSEEWHD